MQIHQADKITKIGLIISDGCNVKSNIFIHLLAPLTSYSEKSIKIINKSKKIKEKKDILLIFLLSKFARAISKKIEKIKKIVCLFKEKYSSIENESIKPVKPNDKINIKFILSTDSHKFNKYFIIFLNYYLSGL